MKILNTFFLLLVFSNVKAQIDLSVAEDYIKGDSISLFSHLSKKGYVLTKDTIWPSNIGLDSVYEYTHKQGVDVINVIKNKGFIISPIVSDDTDYYSSYLEQLLTYLIDDGEKVELIENLDNGAMKITTRKEVAYVVDPARVLIMMY